MQSGSVLVNLDVPWNPAVLEQRNGRVHRLGQTRKVQIITMVAANSYEEDVLALAQNKQNLFDNVIGEDGTEDVVGVSKKLLETLVKSLAGKSDDETEKAPKQPEEDSKPREDAQLTGRDAGDSRLEQAITLCIEELQNAFGSRIERIIGSGGGLLAVLDLVNAKDDRFAADLSAEVPVADSHTYYDAAVNRDESKKTSRLAALAAEKLKAAQVLVEQQCPDSSVELLLSALLAAASDRAGLDHSIAPRDAGVWIYGEALPKGILNQDETALIMRGITLAQSQSVPENLITQLIDDVESFVTYGS
ncbi:MAG: hypothetical protein J7L69_08365 [Desulfobulbaceae bacterium]|nr:hypothetical protein [Desulfobulbaceae bacterium]